MLSLIKSYRDKVIEIIVYNYYNYFMLIKLHMRYMKLI